MGSYDRDEPTIADVLAMHADALRNELHTALPAKVNAYDAEHQTVDVTPLLGRYLPTAEGGQEFEALPQVLAVPVCFPRAGAYGITFPIAQGDTVLLVFSHLPIGTWKTTGAEGESGDTRTHSLDGAVAIPGLYPQTASTSQTDDALVLYGAKVKIGDVSASHPMALADNVKKFCDNILQYVQSHTHLVTVTTVQAGALPNPSGSPVPSPTMPPTIPPAFIVPQIESQKHKLDG